MKGVHVEGRSGGDIVMVSVLVVIGLIVLVIAGAGFFFLTARRAKVAAVSARARAVQVMEEAERARAMEEMTGAAGSNIDPADAPRLWQLAAWGVKQSASYGGLDLSPQEGLLPLGADPKTELWEFAHLASGEPAGRGADGALVVNDDTGIVLVLVPAQAGHPPFFIAKWPVKARQMGGVNPTAETLAALGLAFATEAQKARAAYVGWTRANDGLQPVRELDE